MKQEIIDRLVKEGHISLTESLVLMGVLKDIYIQKFEANPLLKIYPENLPNYI